LGYWIILPVIGYIIGSIPFGFIAGRLISGVDVRNHGSGMTGMTNVVRTMGYRIGIPVLLLDLSKGITTVLLVRIITPTATPGIESISALAVIIGHIWPVFAGFRGGRGIAPGLGGLMALEPTTGLIAGMTGAITIAISRYVSLGSILGTVSGSVVLIILYLNGNIPVEYIWYVSIGAPLVIIKHKDNISRLINGNERRIGKRSE